MGRSLLLVATLASLAALLANGAMEPSLRGCSRLALAALPWIALSGLPVDGRARAGARDWPLALALALPVLALGAWLDLRADMPVRAALMTGAASLALLALLGEAAQRANVRPGWHALAWALLVPAGPLLLATLGVGFAPARWLGALSPWSWAWGRVALDAAPDWERWLAGPLIAGLALLACGLAARERAA